MVRVDRAIIPVGMTGLGIIMAYILETLHSKGVIVDEMVSGSITINDLMTIIVFFFLFVGTMWAAVKR